MSEAKKTLKVGSKSYQYWSLEAARSYGNIDALPISLKVLLENLLRYHEISEGKVVSLNDVKALANWSNDKKGGTEIAFHPARVLMQDFTGVPGVVDLATMREALKELGEDPKKINPLSPVDLVIDHSLSVEKFATPTAFKENVDIEFASNRERYAFLRWGQKAFNNFRVVPPGTGICHQVNLESLAKTVWTKTVGKETWAFPDTLVGTDSHTTMINGLAVLGWGVGGIEAEAAMLGQPVSMLIPEVVGFKLIGKMKEGNTATDLVLTVVEMLRKKGVVGKFVEFFGPGLDELSLADRATLANMAPEYGATCGFFPIDDETINYLKFTGRDQNTCELVEAYAKAQGLWRTSKDPVFTDTLELDLGKVVPSLAGPKRPQDRINLDQAAPAFKDTLVKGFNVPENELQKKTQVEGKDYCIQHGDVVIAAITSCTNTSNPSVLIAAGLVAKKARERGLKTKPWVKPSLAPGSQVVTDYLVESGLQKYLDELGFNLVGYGCTTCIGNSGPLPAEISAAVTKGNHVAVSVLSGNRNFEGRVNPDVKANYLASPPLVVAYALAGSIGLNLAKEPLGKDKNGKEVFLKDIWPTNKEIKDTMATALTPEMFKSRYANVFTGPKEWQAIPAKESLTYDWDKSSTYIKLPTYFEGFSKTAAKISDIHDAKVLAILGDSVTTDHISPAGSIKKDSPAGKYLMSKGVEHKDFNSYGARRGNHEVMMRGTFANIRIKNEMCPGVEGPYTMFEGQQMFIYDAAVKHMEKKRPLIVIGGKEYGTGSSRDWAAKGTNLLGVKAVIVETFERIHRSNLIGMGVLPLQFIGNENRKTLKLTGNETFSITGFKDQLKAQQQVDLVITYADGKKVSTKLLSRLDTQNEVEYFRHGGILQYVMRNLISGK
jgi:aconitate hydratase